MLNPLECAEIQKNTVTFPIHHDHVSDASKIWALKLAHTPNLLQVPPVYGSVIPNVWTFGMCSFDLCNAPNR